MRFDPTRCAFPRPGIPLRADRATYPTLAGLFRPLGRSPDAANFRHYTRGRYALNDAYRLAGLGPGNILLAPAYHCVTMLDPAMNIGADVLLYPLHADLSPDVAGLDRLLQISKKPVRALLATHFFGLARDYTDLKRWCDAHGIVLIEDCSHVLFTEHYQSAGTGIYGKFVTASPYKFFPGDDGGLLYAPDSRDIAGIRTKRRGMISELKGIKHLLDKTQSRDVVPFELCQLNDRLTSLVERPLIPAEELCIPYAQPSRQFVRRDTEYSSLFSSRRLALSSSVEHIVRARRLHFRRWLATVAELPHCHAIYSDLPPDFTPYMFPLHIKCPTPHFYWLKQLGFPIWRWDELAASDCPVAQDYRLHLLHLPCHQSLSSKQLDWMTATLKRVVQINGHEAS
ncbi:MAG: DegT/DnrJ/EryC1/StrS family aminotransferase [Propionivibrio sp.]